MSKDIKLGDLKSLPAKLGEALGKLKRYAVLVFVVLVAGIYGFLVLRVSSLQNAQPNTVSGTQKVTTVATPRIDPKLVQQLQQLQDNSVSVKSLFDNARSNPFQE